MEAQLPLAAAGRQSKALHSCRPGHLLFLSGLSVQPGGSSGLEPVGLTNGLNVASTVLTWREVHAAPGFLLFMVFGKIIVGGNTLLLCRMIRVHRLSMCPQCWASSCRPFSIPTLSRCQMLAQHRYLHGRD